MTTPQPVRVIRTGDRIRYTVNDRRRVDTVRAFAVRDGVVCFVVQRAGEWPRVVAA